MARIYRVSGYVLDKTDVFPTEKNAKDAIKFYSELNGINFRQLHAEGSVNFILDGKSKLHDPNCDMAEYEKLFVDNMPVNFEKDRVIVGKVYKHFKGNKVLVIAISRNTERINDVSVVYECEDGRIWNRPYNMFISKVDKEKYPDVDQEYRFEMLDEEWIERR